MNQPSTIAALVERLGALAPREAGTRLGALVAAAAAVSPSREEVERLKRADAARPYGRHVLLATPAVEVMIAEWTPGVPCAPHDHGGASGAVRILSGAAQHHVWAVVDGALQRVREERVEAGEVLACGPGMVHSMVGDAAGEPLITLHLYADPIDHMVVYDLDAQRTLVVDGGCGAWVPDAGAGLLRARAGFHRDVPKA